MLSTYIFRSRIKVLWETGDCNYNNKIKCLNKGIMPLCREIYYYHKFYILGSQMTPFIAYYFLMFSEVHWTKLPTFAANNYLISSTKCGENLHWKANAVLWNRLGQVSSIAYA